MLVEEAQVGRALLAKALPEVAAVEAQVGKALLGKALVVEEEGPAAEFVTARAHYSAQASGPAKIAAWRPAAKPQVCIS